MASLPRERAGVGSAVLNTVRQVGGALGVAVLGSVLAAVYRDRIGDLSGLPEPAQAAARESISGAYGVAERAGPAGPAVINAANDAFVTAMHWAATGSAIMARGRHRRGAGLAAPPVRTVHRAGRRRGPGRRTSAGAGRT